ncbi:MAG: polysaccharide deacetylase family protein [Actinobacteria bacterium]|nr:polysaccharide deacetylase family protein [Actinomycetota bacterium]
MAQGATALLVSAAMSACAAGSGSRAAGTTRAASTQPARSTTTVAATTTATSTTLESLVAPPPATAPTPMAGVQVVSKIPVAPGNRVVFLTIDDGLVRDPEFTRRFIAAGIPVTIFPVATAVAADPAFFAEWLSHGAVLGNHTINHPNLPKLGLAGQQREICGAADILTQKLGQRPRFVRAPYGNYNAVTKQALASCGFKYLVYWHAAVNDGRVQFQAGSALQPGDIILMHFRKTFDIDFDAALAQARKDDVKFGVLADYLPG